jgi:hypothetical protein
MPCFDIVPIIQRTNIVIVSESKNDRFERYLSELQVVQNKYVGFVDRSNAL